MTLAELFDQDRNPGEFDPPPRWVAHLDARMGRRFTKLAEIIATNQEAIMATLDELTAAAAGAVQAGNDLAARVAALAANPVPQAVVDSLNGLAAQLAGLDPAAVAPAVDPNAPPTV